MVFMTRQRVKDLLLRTRVVVRTSNVKISGRLANYVKILHQKACCTCSTIVFLHSTNQIIDLWRCRWRCRRQILNSQFSLPTLGVLGGLPVMKIKDFEMCCEWFMIWNAYLTIRKALWNDAEWPLWVIVKTLLPRFGGLGETFAEFPTCNRERFRTYWYNNREVYAFLQIWGYFSQFNTISESNQIFQKNHMAEYIS